MSSSQPPPPDAVERFLADLSGETRELVLGLRRLISGVAPATEETVVWGSLSYHLPALGGRVKGAVCQISPKADHVQLGFVHGVLLPDPRSLLRGEGKAKRHVRLEPGGPLPVEALEALVRAAETTRPATDP